MDRNDRVIQAIAILLRLVGAVFLAVGLSFSLGWSASCFTAAALFFVVEGILMEVESHR